MATGQFNGVLHNLRRTVLLRDGRALRALVVAGGRSRLVGLGRFAAAEEALLRLRADLDAQAGHAMPNRLARAVHVATRHDAAVLGEVILGPLLPHVGDRELVVVPTGALITVPWAMIPGTAGRAVTVAPSANRETRPGTDRDRPRRSRRPERGPQQLRPPPCRCHASRSWQPTPRSSARSPTILRSPEGSFQRGPSC